MANRTNAESNDKCDRYTYIQIKLREVVLERGRDTRKIDSEAEG